MSVEDKTPYKTNVGVQFRHEQGKDVHAPGFYLHLEPGACFAGVGMWRPEAKVARVIRERIYEHPDEWRRATRYKLFTSTWSMTTDDDGDRLKRVPRDFDPDFEYADDLRLKTFIAVSKLTHKAVTSPDLGVELARRFKVGSNLNRFLSQAVGLPY